MRRWNGWGFERVEPQLPRSAKAFLMESLGSAQTGTTAPLEDLLLRVPASRLPKHDLVHATADHRLRHARGQSFPDWVALRYGTCDTFPDGVAYPATEEQVLDLIQYAQSCNARIIPYGGGSSVVGHINPLQGNHPVLTVDLTRLNELLSLDEASLLATFQAGIIGPHIEAQLQARGFTLGHFPQSFEFSTLGGWIATRSSGQQSLQYGRIEDLFAGGTLLSPAGKLTFSPFPASAAGPDLREMVLGSEGRLGIITRAIMRVSPIPQQERFDAIFFPNWFQGMAAVQQMVQSGLHLSMLRLMDSVETRVSFLLAGQERMVSILERILKARGLSNEKCMLLFAVTGNSSRTKKERQSALRIAREHGSVCQFGTRLAEEWRKKRFYTPYLRNTLWENGYAVDTLETVFPWSSVRDATGQVIHALHCALDPSDERVLAMAHLSHVYPTGASLYVTYLFRLAETAQESLCRWQRLKGDASESILRLGGTISHQHGVGLDHLRYAEREKGPLGVRLLQNAMSALDSEGIMNPGKLVKDP